MAGTHIDTLFLPFVMGDVPCTGKILFVGGLCHPFVATLNNVYVYQPFKPWADSFNSSPCVLLKNMSGKAEYDVCLVNIPKQKEEAQFWLASALENLKAGGVLAAAAANDSGGARIDGWMKELGLETHVMSKNKARVVWAQKPQQIKDDVVAGWKDSGASVIKNFGEGLAFKTIPGVFSWDRVDKGSFILSDYIPKDIKGAVADFGSGIGYLSHEMLRASKNISTLYVVEGDARALDCSRENLEGVKADAVIEYHWHDLSNPLPNVPPLDFIIMNPPFHQGAKQTIGIGQSFVKNAAHHLRKNGVLMMVANTHLPYEDSLKQYFASFKIIAQSEGFKVIEAKK